MVRAFCVIVAALSVCAVAACAQSPTEALAAKTSLCELAQNPEAFDGRMIWVRASAMGRTVKDLWIDDFEQKPACSAWMGVIVALPEQLRPKPELDLVRDAPFQQFCADIRTMNVQAIFEGRFEAAYTWKDQKRIGLASARGKN